LMRLWIGLFFVEPTLPSPCRIHLISVYDPPNIGVVQLFAPRISAIEVVFLFEPISSGCRIAVLLLKNEASRLRIHCFSKGQGRLRKWIDNWKAALETEFGAVEVNHEPLDVVSHESRDFQSSQVLACVQAIKEFSFEDHASRIDINIDALWKQIEQTLKMVELEHAPGRARSAAFNRSQELVDSIDSLFPWNLLNSGRARHPQELCVSSCWRNYKMEHDHFRSGNLRNATKNSTGQ